MIPFYAVCNSERLQIYSVNRKQKFLISFLLWGMCAMIFPCQSQDIHNDFKSITDSPAIGKLRFIASDDKTEESEEYAFITKWKLREDKYLAAHFTLAHPLEHYLSLIAVNKTDKDIKSIGNFQFTFLVDDQIIYVENLHPGAGSAEAKSTQLSYRVPMVTEAPIDFWGWFMWLKFMKLNGGRDALHTGTHNLSIEVRPYVNQGGIRTGELLAKGNLTVEVSDIPVAQDKLQWQTIAPLSGWPVSQQQLDREKITALYRKIAQGRFEHIKGIVVIKNQKLALEAYFNGSSRDSLHDARSVSKSIASAITGIAIDDGYLENEYLTLDRFYKLRTYKNFSLQKEKVTLHQLLSMSSGFIGDDTDMSSVGNEQRMYPTSDWTEFALSLPMDDSQKATSSFSYFTAGVVILGDILHHKVPGGLVAYTRQRLFGPLEIENYSWQYTPKGVGNTAGGLRLRALDFAKFGQLYKNKGVWNGRRIIDESWIEKSLSNQVMISETAAFSYGYLFWNKTFKVQGKDIEVSYCSGNGGNKIFICKDLPLVVVITAAAYNLPYAHKDAEIIFTDFILPAVFDQF